MKSDINRARAPSTLSRVCYSDELIVFPKDESTISSIRYSPSRRLDIPEALRSQRGEIRSLAQGALVQLISAMS